MKPLPPFAVIGLTAIISPLRAQDDVHRTNFQLHHAASEPTSRSATDQSGFFFVG